MAVVEEVSGSFLAGGTRASRGNSRFFEPTFFRA